MVRTRNISLLAVSTFFSLTLCTYSQDSVYGDLKFVSHLVDAGLFREALFELDSGRFFYPSTSDSANYYRGWCLHSFNRNMESSGYLKMVGRESGFFVKSRLYASYNFSAHRDYDNALSALNEIETDSGQFKALKIYEQAGISLLSGNAMPLDEFLKSAYTEYPAISEPAGRLKALSFTIREHKKRSVLAAGLFSAIIPGSGKCYAGRVGEGIAAFLSTVSLGLVTWENYRKDGWKDFKTIAFGSAFAISYMANIYGSAVSVRINENRFNENIRSTVMLNLRVPLDRIFDTRGL